jgi:hypothetical protein
MTPQQTRLSCLSRNADWRREAGNIRVLANRAGLVSNQRENLLREAKTADACADEWLNAAIDLPEPSGRPGL